MEEKQTHSKKKLLHIARKVNANERLTHEEIETLNNFAFVEKERKISTFLKNAAFPFAVLLGAIMAMYASNFEKVFDSLPGWTHLNEHWQAGFDYVWSIIGNPVEKSSILFHVPNIIMYGVGVISIKSILDAVKHRNWLDIVTEAQGKMREQLESGTLSYDLHNGHSILFTGKGDFIGMQFTLDHNPADCITLAEVKPSYSNIWNMYKSESHEEDLNKALQRVEAQHAGEYIFFPVQDIHIFLPSPTAYDMPPHRIDLHCQYIRKLEALNNWETNPIFIVGDKFHHSLVKTEDKTKIIDGSEDVISIDSIAKRYSHVQVVDPTEIVLKHILKMAHNRKIVFRATDEGIQEYKKRFYERLEMLGYGEKKHDKGIFIVGYDIYEDQIEQQKICGKLDDYYPVVLSKNVYDALLNNGHKDEEMIYVPDLVIEELKSLAAKQ